MHYPKPLKKKLNKLIAVLLLCTFLQMNVATAQDVSTNDPYSGGELSIASCLSKGGFDFGLFIDSLTYNDSVQEGLIEPWNDVLKRNSCQATDVLGLIKQEDKIRKSIRDAFLTCNTQKIEHLKKSYTKMLVEIYYVRHVVNGGIVMSLPYDVSTRIGSNAAVTDPNVLYEDMYLKYVNSTFYNEDDFNDLYLMLKEKYGERKDTYLNCKTSSWQGVKEKWDEFKNYFAGGGITNDLGKSVKSLSASANSLKNEAATIKTYQLLTNDLSVSEYLKSMGQVNLNKFEFQEGKAQISNYFSKSLPTISASPSQNELLNAVASEHASYELSKLQNDLSAEFQEAYFTFSDQNLEVILNNLDGRNVPEDGLLETIQLSLPTLDIINIKSKSVNSRQCTQ